MDIDTSTEVLRLRATVRDLLALSIIPEAWVGRDPPAIAADLADLLIGSLELDFAFVRLGDPTANQAVEVTRGDGWKGFPPWLQERLVRFGQNLSNGNRDQCWRVREILLRDRNSYWSKQRG